MFRFFDERRYGKRTRADSDGRRVRRFAVMAICLIWVSIPHPEAVAAERDGTNVEFTTRLYDTTVVFPPPSWQQSAKGDDESEINRKQSGNAFIMEFIPKGETFSGWSKLHAVAAIKTTRLSFPDFVRMSFAPYYQSCGKEELRIQEIERSDRSLLVSILCGDSSGGPSHLGYRDGLGEVTLMWFGFVKDTKIKVYHHWRGASFDADDKNSWPIEAPTYDRTVQEFRGIRMVE